MLEGDEMSMREGELEGDTQFQEENRDALIQKLRMVWNPILC